MRAIYTWDVYSSLDGFASYNAQGDWGGYWGKEGPQFLRHREEVLAAEQTFVLGANTFREFHGMLGPTPVEDLDPVNARMKSMPTLVLSKSLQAPLEWPNATLVAADAVDHIGKLKQKSAGALRSHGSLSMNRGLMAAGLVDRLQVSIFPVLTGQTGQKPIFAGAEDFDLELIESRLFDGRVQELIYRPHRHR